MIQKKLRKHTSHILNHNTGARKTVKLAKIKERVPYGPSTYMFT